MEADVEIPSSQTDQQLLQPSKSADINRKRTCSETAWAASGVSFLPAGVVKGVFDGLEAVSTLQPRLDLRCLAGRGQPHHGSSRHAVAKDTADGSASKLQRPDRERRRFYADDALGSSWKRKLTAMARQPRLVLATKQPSVVAKGTWNCFPSRCSGPATPTGTGM